jgi:8-oxo-dGTP diphosphatase
MAYDLFEVRMGNYIFNKEGKLLLLKNNKGTWGILGGHLDKGEQIIETIYRESKEEANIEVEVIEQFNIEVVENSFIISFVSKHVSGEIKLQDEEIKDYKWIPLNELNDFNLTFEKLPKYVKKAFEIFEAKK